MSVAEQVGRRGGRADAAPAVPADRRAPEGTHDVNREGRPAAGKRAALRVAVWTVAGFGSGQILRVASNLILTRLLVPEAFGIMALANALLIGLHLFSDVGIGPSIIQRKGGDDPRFLNTAWTMQVVRGVVLGLGLALLAWPVAIFYETPLLLWVVPAVGFNAVLAGLNSTSLHTLGRRLVRGPLVLLNLGSYVVGTAATFAWVLWVQADVWGFVIGGLVTSLVTLIGSHLLEPGFRNQLCWDQAAFGELVRFGKWVFLSTLCTFLGDQADRLVVGKVASLETLGVYQIAHQLTWVAICLLGTVSKQVVFPLYSRQNHSEGGIRPGLRWLHPLVAGCGAATATGLFVVGPALIDCLYGERYEAAGWMVRFLAVGALFKMLEMGGNSALLAAGNAKATAFSNGVRAIALVPLLPAGYLAFGLPGLLGAFAAADLIRYAATMLALRRSGMCVLRCDMALLLCTALIGAAAWWAGQHAGLSAGRWAGVGVGSGVILLLWAGVLLAGWLAWQPRAAATA
jgi:O-antigen/teichoic acid export membrane protein